MVVLWRVLSLFEECRRLATFAFFTAFVRRISKKWKQVQRLLLQFWLRNLDDVLMSLLLQGLFQSRSLLYALFKVDEALDTVPLLQLIEGLQIRISPIVEKGIVRLLAQHF